MKLVIRFHLALMLVLQLACAGWAQEAKETTLERIKREGVLRWGADPSGGAPYAFLNPSHPTEVIGFEVELVGTMCGHMGVKPELVRMAWESLVPNLDSGRIDLAVNGLEVNEARAKKVDFSVPYYRYFQQITVRVHDRNRYTSLDQLKDKKISVLNGSESIHVLKRHGWTSDDIVGADDSFSQYQVLLDGRVDASLADGMIAQYYAGKNPELYNLAKVFAPGVYAAAVRKGDEELLKEVNRILTLMKSNGELGVIYQRWNIWNSDQQELGISRGPETGAIPESYQVHGANWPAILKLLAKGTGVTIFLTVSSMPLAVAFGLILALMARSRNRLWSTTSWIYIQVMRGTPLLVQIFLIYYTLPAFGEMIGHKSWFRWDPLIVGIICLAANYAAYEAEIHRAGLDAVPKGQREAALSLGMSENQAFFFVILPQSFRIILPPILNDFNAMLKDSSLVSVITVQELLTVATSIGKAQFNIPQMLVIAAGFYLAISWIADFFGKRLEARLKRRGVSVPQSSL